MSAVTGKSSKFMTHVALPGDEIEVGRRDGERRKRTLADDHRVDELDRDMRGVGPGLRRRADREQPAATRESLRHGVAETRDAVGLGREELLAGL